MDNLHPSTACAAGRGGLAVVGMVVGFAIGVVASLLGVAGGELLIPTLVLLFGVDIKLAGSLSLAISLPTMLVGFARYSQDRSFAVLSRNRGFALIMATGSVVGAFVGGQILGLVPSLVLLPTLAAILLVSAVKVWRHHPAPAATELFPASLPRAPARPLRPDQCRRIHLMANSGLSR
jgi:uncharacterized membrane protein YfcA